ncbi:MAG: linaridin-like RiPP [Saccharothrix sp.]|nr:linaridin-like RiPP [Saccharothrix sp.]
MSAIATFANESLTEVTPGMLSASDAHGSELDIAEIPVLTATYSVMYALQQCRFVG